MKCRVKSRQSTRCKPPTRTSEIASRGLVDKCNLVRLLRLDWRLCSIANASTRKSLHRRKIAGSSTKEPPLIHVVRILCHWCRQTGPNSANHGAHCLRGTPSLSLQIIGKDTILSLLLLHHLNCQGRQTSTKSAKAIIGCTKMRTKACSAMKISTAMSTCTICCKVLD